MSDNSLEAIIADHVAMESESETPAEPVEAVEEQDTVEDEAVEAESGEEVSEDTAPEENPEVVAVKSSMQKRIDRQTAALKEAQEKYAELERQINARTSEEKPAVDLVKPNIDDFDSMEDYDKAVDDYATQLAEKKASDTIAKQKQEAEYRANMEVEMRNQEVFNSRLETFKQDVPDFDDKSALFMETVSYLQNSPTSNPKTLDAIGQILREVDAGPRLIYELGSNPDKAEQLASMTPVNAAFELFKMQYGAKKLPASPKPESKPLPRPVKGLSGSGKVQKSLDDMSGDEILQHLGM